MTRDDLVTLAKGTARGVLIDPALLCALVEQESSWNPWSMRFEPAFLRHYVKPVLPDAPSTTEIGKATSWGLCQTMGLVAEELGFQGKFFSELCDPQVGLLYGAKKLRQCLESRGEDVEKALLAYNGGGNLAYPAQVQARMKNYY